MKAASVSDIKKELKERSSAEVLELCLRLVRYKKENKELLTFLLFEASDIDGFLQSVKEEIKESMREVNTSNLYFAKKSLRKILRSTNKYIKYASSKTVEAELLIFYCQQLKQSSIPYKKSTALVKLFEGQLKKAQLAVTALHEDLQYEYQKEIEAIK